jgi:hypothetical protein
VSIVPQRWILLSYRLPREPSTPRIAVWRRLRRLGAAQLLDGLVALPYDARTREQLEWVAGEVQDAGGETTLWIAEPSTSAQHRALAERMRATVGADYLAVVEAAHAARDGRALGRLRRTLQQIRARDFFESPERRRAERAVDALTRQVESLR